MNPGLQPLRDLLKATRDESARNRLAADEAWLEAGWRLPYRKDAFSREKPQYKQTLGGPPSRLK